MENVRVSPIAIDTSIKTFRLSARDPFLKLHVHPPIVFFIRTARYELLGREILPARNIKHRRTDQGSLYNERRVSPALPLPLILFLGSHFSVTVLCVHYDVTSREMRERKSARKTKEKNKSLPAVGRNLCSRDTGEPLSLKWYTIAVSWPRRGFYRKPGKACQCLASKRRNKC